MEELNNAWSAASQEIYQSAAQEQAQPGQGAAEPGAQAEGGDSDDDEAVDADFEVVDDDDNS
jgi:molecular chaperone DnaK